MMPRPGMTAVSSAVRMTTFPVRVALEKQAPVGCAISSRGGQAPNIRPSRSMPPEITFQCTPLHRDVQSHLPDIGAVLEDGVLEQFPL